MQPDDPLSTSEHLIWSSEPGRRERHLRRRYRNLLFPPERRHVTVAELLAAQEVDREETLAIKRAFQTLLSAIQNLPDEIPLTRSMEFLRTLDELRDICVAEGGTTLQFLPGLDQLEGVITQTIEERLTGASEKLARFRSARELVQSGRMRLGNPVVLGILKGPPEDVVILIANESPDGIALVLQALNESPEILAQVRTESIAILENAMLHGFPEDEAARRIAALRI